MVHHAKNEHIDVSVAYLFSFCFIVVTALSFFILPRSVIIGSSKLPNIGSSNQTVSFFNKTVFEGVAIDGKAFVVYDLVKDEVVASNNEATLLPLASITKVMMALSATHHTTAKQSTIVIEPSNIEGGYDLGLRKNQRWTLPELLKYTLVFSSNDGAESVASSFGGKEKFVQQMNEDAKYFGLSLTFTDPAGRDMDGYIGGMGSALEAAKLFGVAYQNIPELLDATTKRRLTVTSSSGRVSGVPNTNQYIEDLPGAEASKTGYTDLAGGNLGVIVDVSVGRPVVIIVLGSTREGRFKDMAVLYSLLRKSIATTTSITSSSTESR